MKLNILSTAALLALLGAAFAPSAKAQFTTTGTGSASSEDLILSFQDSNVANPTTGNAGDNGSGFNYEIDLGNVDKYLNATSTIMIANIGADLSSLYSTGNYFTNSNISFGILGANSSGTTDNAGPFAITNNSLFVSQTNPSQVLAAQAKTTQGANATATSPIYRPASGSPVPTDGTTPGSYIVSTSNTSSFNQVNSDDGINTGNLASFGGAQTQLYLETLVASTGSPVSTGSAHVDTSGYFTMTSDGEVEFVVATPEPSTYAMMFLGAAALIWIVRRQKLASL